MTVEFHDLDKGTIDEVCQFAYADHPLVEMVVGIGDDNPAHGHNELEEMEVQENGAFSEYA